MAASVVGLAFVHVIAGLAIDTEFKSGFAAVTGGVEGVGAGQPRCALCDGCADQTGGLADAHHVEDQVLLIARVEVPHSHHGDGGTLGLKFAFQDDLQVFIHVGDGDHIGARFGPPNLVLDLVTAQLTVVAQYGTLFGLSIHADAVIGVRRHAHRHRLVGAKAIALRGFDVEAGKCHVVGDVVFGQQGYRAGVTGIGESANERISAVAGVEAKGTCPAQGVGAVRKVHAAARVFDGFAPGSVAYATVVIGVPTIRIGRIFGRIESDSRARFGVGGAGACIGSAVVRADGVDRALGRAIGAFIDVGTPIEAVARVASGTGSALVTALGVDALGEGVAATVALQAFVHVGARDAVTTVASLAPTVETAFGVMTVGHHVAVVRSQCAFV